MGKEWSLLGLPRPLLVAIVARVKRRFVLKGGLRTQSVRRSGLDNLTVAMEGLGEQVGDHSGPDGA